MEISELKAFIAVTDTGSFSGAARQIHLTQPAISKRIAHLESRLDQSLFDRIGHQIALTEAGQRLVPHARTILNALQDGLHDVSRLTEQPSGTLRIATSYHVGLHHLPDILKSYYNDYPAVELDLRFMDSEEALAGVDKGDIELAIITLPLNLPDHLHAHGLWQDPMQIVCAEDHPLASSYEMSDLSNYPAVLPDSYTITRQLVETELAKHGLNINVRLSSNHLESIRMMVEIGLGWSVLPETLSSDRLHTCHFEAITFSRELGIITHKQRTLTRAAELLIDRMD
ncbi:MAG: LysR family transcriptional regulator [Gammaproteobacteria bacterium]|nr:LysR family transcriptional regulator [Gammaproteobacteria bacterium]